MFESKFDKLYEGIYEIKRVTPINDEEVLVEFTTIFYTSEEEAKDPTELQGYDYGPKGNSIQSVKLDVSHIPDVDDFNSGNRNQIYEVLTEQLDLKVKDNE